MSQNFEEDPRPCFIVSTGRCGSKMIASVLDLHPSIAAHHEPMPPLNTEAYLRWSGRKGSGYIYDRLAKKRDDLILATEAEEYTYVESSHFLSHLIPELRDRYTARFVHLYRDGRHFTRSGLEREWYVDPGAGEKMKRWLRRRTGLLIGLTFQDHRLKPPPDMTTQFEKIAWLWAEINRVILKALGDVPNTDVMELRLEDFGVDAIRELLAFVGHAANTKLVAKMKERAEDRPNRTATRVVPTPEDWGASTVNRFWEIAGEVMKQLGYRNG